MATKTTSFATYLIVGTTCFLLGTVFSALPYDYYVLWSQPPDRAPYFDLQETHLKFIHSSPPLIARILHIVIGTGLIGFLIKLYKPSESNMLFDGASLVLYMCGVTVYIANIVKGLRVITAGSYGRAELVEGEAELLGRGEYIGREDSLRVMAASNTILALVFIGVLVLQSGQWYAQRKEDAEMAEMNAADDRKRAGKKKQ